MPHSVRSKVYEAQELNDGCCLDLSSDSFVDSLGVPNLDVDNARSGDKKTLGERTAELYSCEKSGGLIHEHPCPRCSALAVTSKALG